MSLSDASRKLTIRIGYDASEVISGTPATKQQITGLANELRGLKGAFAAGGASAQSYADDLQAVRQRAIQLASGLDTTSREYAQLAGVAGQATCEIERNERAMQSAANETQRASSSFRDVGASVQGSVGGVGLLAKGVGALGLSFGAVEIARKGFQLSELGTQATQTQRAFEAFSGSPRLATANLEAMSRATDGGISRMEAMRVASGLLSLGLVDNAQELEKFVHNAAVVAAGTGQNQQAYIDELTAAALNSSFLRLDQLGLSASVARDRIAELKQSQSDLSQEQMFAIAVSEQLEQKAAALTAAGVQTSTGMQQLRSEISNLTVAFGQDLAPTVDGAARVLAGFLKGAREQGDATTQLKSGFDILAEAAHSIEDPIARDMVAMAALNEETYGLSAGLLNTSTSVYQVQAAFLEAAMAAGFTQGEALALAETIDLLSVVQVDTANTAVEMAAAHYDAEAGMYAASAAASGLIGLLEGVAGAAAIAARELQRVDYMQTATAQGYSDLAAQAKAAAMKSGQIGGGRTPGLSATAVKGSISNQQAIREYEERMEREAAAAARSASSITRSASRISSAGTGAHRAVASSARSGMAEVEKAHKKAAQEAERAAQAAQRAYDSAFSDIRSHVDQAMSFDSSIGEHDALLDRFGLRNENASDEMVRRITDVRDRALEGTRSPWLSLFPELDAGTTDEIAARAEAMMRQVREGIRVDLLDPAAIAADVRESILADRQMDAFKDEVTKMLMPEFGPGEIQAALGEQLGVGFTAAGQTASTELINSITSGVEAELSAQEAQITNTGKRFMDMLLNGARGGAGDPRIIGPLVDACVTEVLAVLGDALGGTA